MPLKVITARYAVHKLSGLVLSKDGSWSLTKTAASTFHLLLAISVATSTCLNGFDLSTWGFYAACAIGHAAYDKTRAQNNALKMEDSK